MDFMKRPADDCATTPAHHRLGPLTRVGGRWLVGDHEGPAHLEFTEVGVVPWAADRPGAVLLWSRFMQLGLHVTPDAYTGSKGYAFLTLGKAPLGLTGPHLEAMVRHPYEFWTGRFSHHLRRYRPAEIRLAGELIQQTVKAGQAQRLGERDWLDGAGPAHAAHPGARPPGGRRAGAGVSGWPAGRCGSCRTARPANGPAQRISRRSTAATARNGRAAG
ncbi:hypothetical protein [Kitasatospora sp. LaBMicrA B282]|uniref:hypothetical protein n=1 Tax=Kitasatospora sp. LaBMicrA B282 TaxID=3420949 RepID=UPI003D0FFEFC